MIKSMTGYGKSSYQKDDFRLDIEIRTVNNRFLNVNFKIPFQLRFAQDKLNKIVNEYIKRGKVDIYINSNTKSIGNRNIILNLEAAKNMHESLKRLTDELDLDKDINSIGIKDILLNEDVLLYETESIDEDEYFNILSQMIIESLDDLDNMRILEGKSLYKDISNNLSKLEDYCNEIKHYTKDIKEEIMEKLNNNISKVLEENVIDKDRLANEVVLYADRYDINEEIIRLESHINQFYKSLESEDSIGKKLDFLCQEILREINTIGSKSSKIEIVSLVIEMKTIIEKIKEQVQNVE